MKKFVAGLCVALAVAFVGCEVAGVNVKGTAAKAVSNVSTGIKNVMSHSSGQSVKTSSSTIDYYFPRDGQAPKPALINVINSAKKNLDIAIYSFTDYDIADAVVNAKNRGVNVRIITDRECSENRSQVSSRRSQVMKARLAQLIEETK